MLVDSTSVESHSYELTLIFCYVEGTSPAESFVEFFHDSGHKSKNMFNALPRFLTGNYISIDDCRGQSYDNASAMIGRYDELKAKVLQASCLGPS